LEIRGRGSEHYVRPYSELRPLIPDPCPQIPVFRHLIQLLGSV